MSIIKWHVYALLASVPLVCDAAVISTASAPRLLSDCEDASNTAEALRFIREQKANQPSIAAECFISRLDDPPDDIAEVRRLNRFLKEGADLLRLMYAEAASGSRAQKYYLDSEIRARQIRRQCLEMLIAEAAMRQNAAESQGFRRETAANLDEEANAIWYRAGLGEKGLEQLDATLSEIEPLYLLDKTAIRWMEAVRSCPAWKPDEAGKVPDYRSSWCPSNCQARFHKMANKLSKWHVGLNPDTVMASKFQLELMRREVKQFCRR